MATKDVYAEVVLCYCWICMEDFVAWHLLITTRLRGVRIWNMLCGKWFNWIDELNNLDFIASRDFEKSIYSSRMNAKIRNSSSVLFHSVGINGKTSNILCVIFVRDGSHIIFRNRSQKMMNSGNVWAKWQIIICTLPHAVSTFYSSSRF